MIDPSGKQHRQLSQYAVSTHEVKLAVVMEFRNSHVDAPFFCKALMRLPKQSFETGYPIRHASWPACHLKALSAGMLDTRPDGSCEFRSEGAFGPWQTDQPPPPSRFVTCWRQL